MSTPYEREIRVTTSGSDEVKVLDFVGRGILDFWSVTRVGGGAIAASLFSRTFTSDDAAVLRLGSNNADTPKLQIKLLDPLLVRVGDTVAIAGTDGSTYDGDHLVTAVSADAHTITFDTTYTVDDTLGTATLAVPSEEQPMYQIGDPLSGTDNANDYPDVTYQNRDVVPLTPAAGRNIGIPRRLYVQLGDAATYVILLRAKTAEVKTS